jgi:hypothetical protein
MTSKSTSVPSKFDGMHAMTDLAAKYNIPDEIMAFVRGGFLEVAEETPDRATVEFRIPSLGSADSSDQYTLYNLVWIHPVRNAEFCHYYDEKPGDLPNFFVRIDTEHSRDEQVEDLETVDDLVYWLSEMQGVKN